MLTEHRVFGPPGTGKTTYLARQIRSAVTKYGPDKVLVTSFTKGAAVEIASRLGNDGVKPNRRQVGTLHSLCYELLGRPLIADLAPTMAIWNDKYKAWRQTPAGSRDNDLTPLTTEGDKLRQQCEVYRGQMKPYKQWGAGLFDSGTKEFYAEWRKFKKDIGAIDFTDMIEEVYGSKMCAPNEPSVIFADETQDYSKLELELLRSWASDSDHMVIAGDDDQAIYGFKGATPDAFLDPPIPDDQKHVLSQSYRLPIAIKEFSDNWIQDVRRRETKKFAAKEDVGSVEDVKLSWQDGLSLVRVIQDNVGSGEGDKASVMVLASCGYMLVSLIRALREKGIPFHNPYRIKNGSWNPMRGGVQRLLEFLSVDPFSRSLWTWKSLWKWVEVLDQEKSGMLRGKKTYIKNLARTSEESNKRVSREEILALFQSRTFPWEGQELTWFERMLMPSKKSLMEYSLRMAKTGGTEALKKKPKIIIGTIHSVKGAQAGTTILFPDLSSSGRQEYLSYGDGRDNITRTFYVGMTRAMDRLLLCNPDSKYAVNFRGCR